MAEAITFSEPLLINDTAIFTDAEQNPYVRDIELAGKLGFTRPRKIRDMIVRHKTNLEKYGSLIQLQRDTSNGGAPAREYYLNEPQALWLIAKSETTKADQILHSMIVVFTNYRAMQTHKPVEQWAFPAKGPGVEVVPYKERITSDDLHAFHRKLVEDDLPKAVQLLIGGKESSLFRATQTYLQNAVVNAFTEIDKQTKKRNKKLREDTDGKVDKLTKRANIHKKRLDNLQELVDGLLLRLVALEQKQNIVKKVKAYGQRTSPSKTSSPAKNERNGSKAARAKPR